MEIQRAEPMQGQLGRDVGREPGFPGCCPIPRFRWVERLPVARNLLGQKIRSWEESY